MPVPEVGHGSKMGQSEFDCACVCEVFTFISRVRVGLFKHKEHERKSPVFNICDRFSEIQKIMYFLTEFYDSQILCTE